MEGDAHVEKATGLEYWFHDPGCAYASPPPRWKQAVLTEVGLYPTVLFVAYTVGLLIEPWSQPVRALISTVLSVTLMTWVVMPNVSRVFRRWLRQKTTA